MQVVIEIHEPPKNGHERWVLAHGNPLPKGHGRLIDADAFAKRLKEISEHHHFENLFGISALAVVLSVVDELTGESLCGYENNPTVIPADKETE